MLKSILETITSPAFAVVSILIFVILMRGWQKRKGEYSIFSDAMRFEDVASRFLTHAFNRATPRTIDDTVSLRPKWGFTLFTPILAWLAVSAAPWADLWASLGITDDRIIFAISATIIGLMLYVWLWQSVFHHVTYDRYNITIIDDLFRTQRRDLDDLLDIQMMEKRPLFQLIFKNAKPIRIASNISFRDRFINDMQTRIGINSGNVPQPTSNPTPEKFPASEPSKKPTGDNSTSGKREIPTNIERF